MNKKRLDKYQLLSVAIVIVFFISLAFTALSFDPSKNIEQTEDIEGDILIEFFISSGACEDCDKAKERINQDIKPVYKDNISIVYYPVDQTEYKQNFEKWKTYDLKTIPSIVIKNTSVSSDYNIYLSYNKILNEEDQILEKAIEYHIKGNYSKTFDNKTITDEGYIEFFGFKINLYDSSLPVLTIILGALDSINPCSFFVLLFLLSLLLHTKSRKKMIIIGSIFIFFSGFIYFLLMTAILNFILVVQLQLIVATIAGIIAIIFGSLNIKDYFFYKKGLTAGIPKTQKPKLYKKMSKLVKITSTPSLIIGTITLAISANTVELLCSFNLPLIYTTVLTSYNLGSFEYYSYILLYNLIYIIPLLIIVSIAVITLGRWKLSEYQGRVLKLFSGIMIFSLGEILIIDLSLLENIGFPIAILFLSIILTFIITRIWKKSDTDIKK